MQPGMLAQIHAEQANKSTHFCKTAPSEFLTLKQLQLVFPGSNKSLWERRQTVAIMKQVYILLGEKMSAMAIRGGNFYTALPGYHIERRKRKMSVPELRIF